MSSLYVYHVEDAEGDVFPEADTMEAALDNYTKGDSAHVLIDDDWQANDSDCGPVQTATITNHGCPEAIMVKAPKERLNPADCDGIPADAIFQCYCEGCREPLFSTDERQDYAQCRSCRRVSDENSPEAVRNRKAIDASDLQSYNAWRRS